MNTPLHILTAAVLLAGGVLAGRAWLPATARGASTRDLVEENRRSTAASAPAAVPSSGHDFEGLRARVEKLTEEPRFQAEMARLDVSALEHIARSLLEASEDPQTKDPEWEKRRVAAAALAELLRREGGAAFGRVAAWPEGFARGYAMATLLEQHIRDHPDACLPWLERFRKEYPGDKQALQKICEAGLSAAAERSAEDFLQIAGMFPELSEVPADPAGGAPDPFGNGGLSGSPFHLFQFGGDYSFAPGFDFGKVYATAHPEVARLLLSDWAHRDPDAAWSALIARPLPDPADACPRAPIIRVVLHQSGEKEGLEWLGKRVNELPAVDRAVFLEYAFLDLAISPENLATFAAGLAPADRRAFINGQLYRTNEYALHPAMATLERRDLIDVLGGYIRMPAAHGPEANDADAAAALLGKLQQRFSLTPEEMARMKVAVNE